MSSIFNYSNLNASVYRLGVFLFILFISCSESDEIKSYDVIVLGTGTGAVSAAIQSARSGSKTLYVNPLEWYGGMLTSAGVSATDGNHNLHSGIWREWREKIRVHYGGIDSLFTGWVSNTMFEPHVGHKYWTELVNAENNLKVLNNTSWSSIEQSDKSWKVEINNDAVIYQCKILIDGTDLGDVAAQLGAKYDVGMDARHYAEESIAPENANDIIQDMTYVAILKDFGTESDKTISRPSDYDASRYQCCCAHECDDPKVHPCETMISYGRLPNDKYMINWPISGNDYNENLIELSQEQRIEKYKEAKNQTLGFVYYLQTELGYKNLGLADDEFETKDRLAYLPYHREGRRVHGQFRFNLNHILDPFEYTAYRTGISVGDYPVDHHNYKSIDPPKIEFPKIPSFNIPMGSLIPKDVDNLVLADKSISVSNIVNGCTRLQPSIILVGQAAGVIASISAQENTSPQNIDVRRVQSVLIEEGVYIMPYQDVSPDDPSFESIQKIGATGILKGEGIPFKWANKTLFYPDSIVAVKPLLKDLASYDARLVNFNITEEQLTAESLLSLFNQILEKLEINPRIETKIQPTELLISRKELAKHLDEFLNPFDLKPVNLQGEFL